MPNLQGSLVSSAKPQSKESELSTSPSQCRPSLPITVKALRYENPCTSFGSALPPMFHTQSVPTASPLNQESVQHCEPPVQGNGFYQPNTRENISEQLYEPQGQNRNNTTNHVVYMQEGNMEHLEDQRRHISNTTSQSACTNNNTDQVPLARTASESMAEDLSNNASSHRSMLREAALNKFRLKRKERCFEKKVCFFTVSIILWQRFSLVYADFNLLPMYYRFGMKAERNLQSSVLEWRDNLYVKCNKIPWLQRNMVDTLIIIEFLSVLVCSIRLLENFVFHSPYRQQPLYVYMLPNNK